MKDYLTSLRTTAWRTAGARYNAYRRLKRREFFSTTSLAIFSATSAAIAFVQKMYVQPNSEVDRYLTTAAACIGILLLTISLIEWGAANGAKAENIFANAESISEFQQKLKLVIAQIDAGSPPSWEEVHSFNKEYESIKSRCNNNHTPLDDKIFQIQKRESPEFLKNGEIAIGNLKMAGYYFWWYSASVFYFLILWAALAGALIYSFFI